MTTVTLIDSILTHTEEVGSTDAENATLRARILERAQEVVDQVWDYADWDFRRTSNEISVLSADDGTFRFPSNFLSVGDHGGLYVADQKRKIEYLEPRELNKMRELEGGTEQYPRFYTMFGRDATFLTTGTLFKAPSANFTINIDYDSQSPTLADNTTDDLLRKVPEIYHRSVILPGVRLLVAVDKGDGRTADFDEWFDKAMRRMKSRYREGMESQHILSQYGGIQSYGAW